MVGAVDRHADVVQQGTAGDDHLGVARAHPVVATIAGSTPALTSRRSSRRAMLRTICMWTQEWSDMPSRSAWTCAMYHQARTWSSVLTASRKPSSLRLPRVGAPDLRLGDRLPRAACAAVPLDPEWEPSSLTGRIVAVAPTPVVNAG